jgi:hypothetical protein
MNFLYQVYGFCENIWRITFWLYYPAVVALLFLLIKKNNDSFSQLTKNFLFGLICLNGIIYLFMTAMSLIDGHPVAYGLLVIVGPAFIGSLLAIFLYLKSRIRSNL